MDVVDAVRPAAGDGGGVGAGKGQVPGVQQQPDAAGGAGQQAVDLGRRLDHGAHVVVEGEPHALPGHPIAEPAQPVEEHRPLVVAHRRTVGDRHAAPALHGVGGFGEHHDAAAAGLQQFEVRAHRRDFRFHLAVPQRRAVPA